MVPQRRCALLLLGLLLIATPRAVRSEFELLVNLVNYTNPSGLCAECLARLDQVTNATELVPVCCDEPTKLDNCNNTGGARCDTRFRWNIRPFGASLETRPVSVPNAAIPPYSFTDCTLSPSTCPFSEISATFNQGQTGFLGVTENPLVISRSDLIVWTGRIQFFIEPVDSGLPNIIDSLLVNLDNLQLGGDFTEEMMFTGFHNISTMTMSFRVQCSPGFCGPDCMTSPTSSPLVAQCYPNGSVVCFGDKRDPSPNILCNNCLYNMDIATNCSTCLKANYDPTTNCQTCLPGYNITTNCSTCIESNYDPLANCQACLPNYNITTNCSLCNMGYDPNSDCLLCTDARYDPTANCNLCLDSNFDPTSGCSMCLSDFYDLQANCTQCLGNRALSTGCSSCLSGYSDQDCTVCENGRDIATQCTSCLPGFTGDDCNPQSALSIELIGGIAGGVGGALFLVIIILVIVVCVLMCQVRRSGHLEVTVCDGPSRNAYHLDDVGMETGTGSSTEHKFQNPIYGPGLDSKTETGRSAEDDHMFPNAMYESSKMKRQDTYSQLRHPSVSPPSHTVSTGTNEFTNKPMYASETNHHQRDVTPVYKTPERRSSSSKEPTPQKENYSRLLRKPTDTSITLQPVPPTPFELSSVVTDVDNQPVYDEAILPSTHSLSTVQPPHSAKLKPGYNEIKDGGIVYDEAYPSSGAVYSELEDPRSTLPPSVQGVLSPNETLYDDTVLLNEQTPQLDHDYAETVDMPPGNPAKPHPYDYIDNPNLSKKPVYTNTLPGKLTSTALSHYDLGN